jgi:hypothetical protein
MDGLQKLIMFLTKLDENDIYYRLNKIRDSIMAEIAVPSQRWEVEFMPDGRIEIEKFITENKIFDENEIEVLFRKFSN